MSAGWRGALLAIAAGLSLAVPAGAETPPPPQPNVPLGQLDDSAAPSAYRLDLTVDPAQPRFSGRVEIDVTIRRAGASSLYLHGRDLAMQSVIARFGNQAVAGRWQQVDDSGVARIDFDRPLPAGPVTLAFAYDAAFNDTASGLFRVKVGDDWYSWSQFESIDARAAFPSFDQPSFKTPFTMTMRTPPGIRAISNAPEDSLTREDGRDVHRFRQTLPLPTYLVAIMAGPFVSTDGTAAPTPQRATPLPLRIVSTRENAGKLDFALDGSKAIVTLLEDYFADGFPYPKLDQITSPVMPGAMENAGADLYSDELLVMDANAPVAQKRDFGMVVAHELAHQWFGDLVTPAWWDDIWLNESFANWMGFHIGHAWRPELNIAAGALAEGFDAMHTDSLLAGRPIRQPITRNSEIDAAFDSITYGKGGHVVSMIAGFMGDDRFREGVRRYMKAHRYGTATSIDFFAAMADAAGDPRIVPAMRSFTDQQGVPLLTFARDGDRFTVSQSRYAPLGVTPPATRWSVPLCARRGEARQCRLLVGEQDSFTLAGAGPLLPNAGGTGYYRFELAPAEWDALIARAGDLSGSEALAVADSLAASVRAGRASVVQLAALAGRLARHPDSHAAQAAASELARIAGSGVLDDRGRKGWRRFVVSLYRPELARQRLDLRAGAYAGSDPEATQRKVQAVRRLAGPGRDKALRRQLERAADAWLAGDTRALDPQWYGDAFGLWLDGRGIDGARRLLDMAAGSQDPVFRPAAIAALAGSGSDGVARWLLEDETGARLRTSERYAILQGVLMTRETREFGYQWMTARLDALLSGGGGIFMAARLPQWLARYCSVDRADTIARELRPRFAGKSGALELERTIETVRNCGVLQEQRGSQLSADFARFR